MFKDIFKGIKPITVILIVISVVCIALGALSFIMFNNERREKITLQDELTEVMKQRKKLSLEIEELKLIKADLEIEIGELEEETKVLSDNYEKEKSQNDVVRLELAQKAERLEKVEGELESAVSEKETLQEMHESEKAKYAELKGRVDKLVEVKNVLEEKVRSIINKQGIELERIVVKSEGELEGRVLVVNREYNFVVVDVGVKDDIELGDFLTIFRNGKYVGEAQIEKIYDTMSAATIVKETKLKAIMVDDNVIVRSN